MSAFYRLQLVDDDDAPVAVRLFEHDYDLGDKVWNPGEVADWSVLEFKLEGKELRDYMVTNATFRLFSGHLAQIIHEHKGERDAIQWLDVDLLNPLDGMSHPYYLLHFTEYRDVLDPEETVTAAGGDLIVKPVLHAGKVAERNIFSYQGGFEIVFVSEVLKEAIEEAGCKGVEFSPAPTSLS